MYSSNPMYPCGSFLILYSFLFLPPPSLRKHQSVFCNCKVVCTCGKGYLFSICCFCLLITIGCVCMDLFLYSLFCFINWFAHFCFGWAFVLVVPGTELSQAHSTQELQCYSLPTSFHSLAFLDLTYHEPWMRKWWLEKIKWKIQK
jgi:hypothetical protein